MPYVAAALLTAVIAHDLPPGVVERAVQVTVRSDAIEVQYQFGMNEQTLRARLLDAGHTPAEPLEALEQQYLEYAARVLPKQLELLLDGRPVEPSSITSQLIYQHHLQFELQFEVPWTPQQRETEFVLRDRNFPELPGHSRLAMRSRGAAQVISDVAPILVRAPRLATGGDPLRPGQRAAPTITARLVEPSLPMEVVADEPAGGGTIDAKGQAADGATASEGSAEDAEPQAAHGESTEVADQPRSDEDEKVDSSEPALPRWLVVTGLVVLTLITLPLLLRR